MSHLYLVILVMLLPGTAQDTEDTWQTDPVLTVVMEMGFFFFLPGL